MENYLKPRRVAYRVSKEQMTETKYININESMDYILREESRIREQLLQELLQEVGITEVVRQRGDSRAKGYIKSLEAWAEIKIIVQHHNTILYINEVEMGEVVIETSQVKEKETGEFYITSNMYYKLTAEGQILGKVFKK